MGLRKFWYDTFHPYGPYKQIEDIIKEEEIYADKYACRELNDPSELESVPTGQFRKVTYEVWVAYHKNTRLPKYKYIRK